ncbi:MAG: hypothetical protein J6336_06610 [Kiritimatiellae bacterium]|nr:hypothetical protein [Kiritimatiellia bacterium]
MKNKMLYIAIAVGAVMGMCNAAITTCNQATIHEHTHYDSVDDEKAKGIVLSVVGPDGYSVVTNDSTLVTYVKNLSDESVKIWLTVEVHRWDEFRRKALADIIATGGNGVQNQSFAYAAEIPVLPKGWQRQETYVAPLGRDLDAFVCNAVNPNSGMWGQAHYVPVKQGYVLEFCYSVKGKTQNSTMDAVRKHGVEADRFFNSVAVRDALGQRPCAKRQD